MYVAHSRCLVNISIIKDINSFKFSTYKFLILNFKSVPMIHFNATSYSALNLSHVPTALCSSKSVILNPHSPKSHFYSNYFLLKIRTQCDLPNMLSKLILYI